MPEPAEVIVGLAAALAAGEPPDPHAARAFAAAVGAWLAGEHRSLDEALNIGGRAGLEGARNRYRLHQRDNHLRAAHALADGTGPWSRCVSLAESVERFEARIWQRWRALQVPPADCAAINEHLWHARRLNGRALPATPEGIRLRTQEPVGRDLGDAAGY